MSELLKSVGSRAATAAAPAVPGAASTMFALGATRWAAFGLRVAVVGLVSAGATAFDAYDSASTAAPAPIVAQAAVADRAPVVARVEAPAVEQLATAPAAVERTAVRAASPMARADQPSKDSRQGQDKVRELIRRGHCLGSCRGSADESDAAR